MKVTEDTIMHLADLARLDLGEKEKEKLVLEMERIISFMDKLNELDTSNIKPREHVFPISNVFREDKVCASYDRDTVLDTAPESEDGCYKVPRVVE